MSRSFLGIGKDRKATWLFRAAVVLQILGVLLTIGILFDHSNGLWLLSCIAAFGTSTMLSLMSMRSIPQTNLGWAAAVTIIGMAMTFIFGLIYRLSINLYFHL